MFCYRITKYDPQYRNSKGIYTKDEWACYSEIGRFFDAKEVTYSDYLKVEKAYIHAVLFFMDCLKVNSLTVEGLEKHSKSVEHLIKVGCSPEWFSNIRNTMKVPKESISEVIRLILRNQIWCRLLNSPMYVHFGYDYYMYMGSATLCVKTIIEIEQRGLFVEDFESPYHPKEE